MTPAHDNGASVKLDCEHDWRLIREKEFTERTGPDGHRRTVVYAYGRRFYCTRCRVVVDDTERVNAR